MNIINLNELILASKAFINQDIRSIRGSAAKNPPAMQEILGSTPGSGSSPGEGNENQFHCSCLRNSTDRGTWWATVHGVTKESDMT